MAKVRENLADNDEFQDVLSPGSKLLSGQYTITKFLNSGGFGITYLAVDSLNRTVVIKECYPDSICRRSGAIVRARSRAHTASFGSVVELFVKEAQNQAKLNHPNIAGVHQVFNDNDTAYMAIDFIEGIDLLDTIETRKDIMPQETENWLRKSLEAVGFIHENNMLHRDISPDNILINKNNDPILIDFGAARENGSGNSRALSMLRVVKDGYSPQEFYIQGGDQNASSDLYALAATFYHVISGNAPKDSQTRLAGLAQDGQDTYEPLAGSIKGYRLSLLQSVDKALSVLPRDRFQSAKDWEEALDGKFGKNAVVSKTTNADPASKGSGRKILLLTSVAVAGLIGGSFYYTTQIQGNMVAIAVPASQIVQTRKPAVVVAVKTPEAPEISSGEAIAKRSVAGKPITSSRALEAAKPVADAIENVASEKSPQPALAPANSIASNRLAVDIPFATYPSSQPEGTFSMVSLIRSDLPRELQVWLNSGSIIYAVNGSLVFDNTSISEAIIKEGGFEPGESIVAKLRIRSKDGAPISEQEMTFNTGYLVELKNGVRFLSLKTGPDTWVTKVVKVPSSLGSELRAGDQVLSEAQSGIAVKTQFDLEKLIKSLDTKRTDRAYMTILRGGQLKSVELSLSSGA